MRMAVSFFRMLLMGGPEGYRPLAEADFDWKAGQPYQLKAVARGAKTELFIDEQKISEAEVPYSHGMYGLALPGAGEAIFEDFRVGK